MLKLISLTLLTIVCALPAGAQLTDNEPVNDSISTATIQMTPSGNVTSEAANFTFLAGGGDTDYLGIGNLVTGDIVKVSTTPLGDSPFFETPDTIVGLFTDTEVMECVGDDAFNNDLDQFPTGFGSLCRFAIPADGDYYVGITGFSAQPFDGAHFETGQYSVTVTITLPEPGVLLQLASGALGLAVLYTRRRANH